MRVKVERSETGIAITGTSVARRSWRKIQQTSATRVSVRKSVKTISFRHART